MRKQGSLTSEKKALDRNLMLGELIRLAFRTPVFAALRAADRRVLQGSMTSEKKALDFTPNAFFSELRRLDSNERPPGYEPGELPTAPLRDVVHPQGLEPWTH